MLRDVTPQQAVELSLLSMAVYDARPAIPYWKPLSLKELGLSDQEADDISLYTNANAAAWVKEAVVDGEKVIAVVFKGTDLLSVADWFDNITGISRHYDKLRPLAEAVERYIRANGIAKVLVTGHSLGAAMAACFMAENKDSAAAYRGVTFGSPGVDLDLEAADPRLLSVCHVEDIVPRAGRRRLFGGYTPLGRTAVIDIKGLHEGGIGMFQAHQIREYVKTMTLLKRNGTLSEILNHEASCEVVLTKRGVQVSYKEGGPRKDDIARIHPA